LLLSANLGYTNGIIIIIIIITDPAHTKCVLKMNMFVLPFFLYSCI